MLPRSVLLLSPAHFTVHRLLTTATTTTNMQLTVAPGSAAALTSDGAIRCLLDTRYPLPDRQSSAAFAHARQLAEELALAIPAQLGPFSVPPPTTAAEGEAPSADRLGSSYTAFTRLHAVMLERDRIWVCLDLFLHDCAPEVCQRMDESVAEPIHILASRPGDGYEMRRSPMLDGRVAQRYAHFREHDKGPRPYFADNLNPPVYINGIRFEGNLDEMHDALMFADDGETWEPQEICGDRRAEDGVLEVLVKWKSGKETWEMYDDMAKSEPELVDGYECLHGKVS